MPSFYPGPPYYFICKKCKHRFSRSIKMGMFCPECKSMRVTVDFTIRK